MALSRPIRILLLALAMLSPAGEAFANVCRSIQAELAAIGRAGAGTDRQTAARASAEASRLYGHMRSIGCDRSGIFAFGAPPPAECAGLRARMQQLQQISASASGGDARRRELQSMLVAYQCNGQPRPPRGEPLVAGLFEDRSRRPSSLEIRPDDPIDPPPFESRIRGVSGRAACVRTCDGFFFPVQLRPGTRSDEGDEVCQALCPATETRLYSMRSREIDDAVSMEGAPYTELPNAFRYRKRFDPACFCRGPGENGADGARVLNPNDPDGGLLPLNGDDPDAQEDLPLRGFGERPNAADPRRPNSAFGKRPPPAAPAPPHPPADSGADRTVSTEEGQVKEFEAKDGTRRTVRIIAPELSRGPAEATAPSAPARAPAP